MTGPRQPRTCSHPINARTLTGVCQAVRMFSPIVESDTQFTKIAAIIIAIVREGVSISTASMQTFHYT